MRTTLDLPVDLVDAARSALGFKSKTDTIILALRELVRRRHRLVPALALIVVLTTCAVVSAQAVAVGGATTTLDFRTQLLNVPGEIQSLALTNPGTLPVVVEELDFTGNDKSQFSQTNTCVGQLAPKARCGINVTFTPTSIGSKSAGLTVELGHDAGRVALVPAGGLKGAATPMSFGGRPVGSITELTATMSNPTIRPETVAIDIAGANGNQFSMAPSTTCPVGGSLQGGATCVIGVLFKPSGAGAKSATLRIRLNSESNRDTALSGTALP